MSMVSAAGTGNNSLKVMGYMVPQGGEYRPVFHIAFHRHNIMLKYHLKP